LEEQSDEAISVLLFGINSAILEIATVVYGNLAMTGRNAFQ